MEGPQVSDAPAMIFMALSAITCGCASEQLMSSRRKTKVVSAE